MPQSLSYHPNPFGSVMQGRSWSDASRNYKFGFNGKEEDKEGMGGGGSTYDYGFRIYNHNLGKFLSLDPLSKMYPFNSPFAFAENRVIEGIDLEGKEFSKTTTCDDNTGKTLVHITVKVKLNCSSEILSNPGLLVKYKEEMQKQFSESLNVNDENRNIQYSGELIFDDEATISVTLADDKDLGETNITGRTTSVCTGNELAMLTVAVDATDNQNGILNLRDPASVAKTLVHEILHVGGIEHPTDASNKAKDVNLIRSESGGGYSTTNSTNATELLYNIMLYNSTIVDGEKISEKRSTYEAVKVSPDQLNILNENIDKGYVNGEATCD